MCLTGIGVGWVQFASVSNIWGNVCSEQVKKEYDVVTWTSIQQSNNNDYNLLFFKNNRSFTKRWMGERGDTELVVVVVVVHTHHTHTLEKIYWFLLVFVLFS